LGGVAGQGGSLDLGRRVDAASVVFGASAGDVVPMVGAQAWRGRGCAQTMLVGRGKPVVGREGCGNP
jgi:hypothetical protein